MKLMMVLVMTSTMTLDDIIDDDNDEIVVYQHVPTEGVLFS